LDWHKDEITIKSLSSDSIGSKEIKSITLIGSKEKLKWSLDRKGLIIKMPATRTNYDYAFPIKIAFKEEIPEVKQQ
jgi:hypothetical protein